jgi:hypothetical protein
LAREGVDVALLARHADVLSAAGAELCSESGRRIAPLNRSRHGIDRGTQSMSSSE